MHPSLRLQFIVDDRIHPRDRDDTRMFAVMGLPLLSPMAQSSALYLGDAIAGGRPRVLQLGTYGNIGLTSAASKTSVSPGPYETRTR